MFHNVPQLSAKSKRGLYIKNAIFAFLVTKICRNRDKVLSKSLKFIIQ